MKRSSLPEQKLVVVLFIMVIITFFFAQADTGKIEKMYLNLDPSFSPFTTSLDKPENREAGAGTKEIKQIKQIVPGIHLR
jgi:hypothetical protein